MFKNRDPISVVSKKEVLLKFSVHCYGYIIDRNAGCQENIVVYNKLGNVNIYENKAVKSCPEYLIKEE